MSTEVGEIIFRPWGQIVPRGGLPDHTWQVEYHEGLGVPLGVAWVLAPPASPKGKKRPGGAFKPYLKFVLVSDEYRREGIATRLIEACRERWPDLSLTRPVSRAGLALYRRFQSPRPPEDTFTKRFIKRFLQGGGTREQLEQLACDQHEAWLAEDEARIQCREPGG
jgi:GNAT superfamily N-acetyltransferase